VHVHTYIQHPGDLYFIAGDYDTIGSLSNIVYKSASGVYCNIQGVQCNGQGTCGNGTVGCVCNADSGYTGDFCDIPPPPGQQSGAFGGWRAVTVRSVLLAAVMIILVITADVSVDRLST
jgi:hypothetical protein